MTIVERLVDLDVTPLSGTIGAIISGVDLRHLDEVTVAAIRRVWLARKVVFVPDQHLDPDAHLAVAALFVAWNTFFVVRQREEAVVLRFGQPERVIHAPGQGHRITRDRLGDPYYKERYVGARSDLG